MNWRKAWCAVVVASAIVVLFLPGIPAVDAHPDDAALLNCKPFAETGLPKAVPRDDPEAIERFQLINREVNASSHTVLFLGDSLTQKWDRSLWDRYFGSLHALNAGVNGDRTEHLLWRIEHGNIDGQHPEFVVLLIGTNDIGHDRPARITAEGVRQILGTLRSRIPTTRILLLGLLPRSDSPGSERRQQVSEVNQLIRTCGDGELVFYADVGGALLDQAGRLTREVSPDGVHLSKQGYALLTDRLEVEFRRMPSAK